jgi:hypothetical protein
MHEGCPPFGGGPSDGAGRLTACDVGPRINGSVPLTLEDRQGSHHWRSSVTVSLDWRRRAVLMAALLVAALVQMPALDAQTKPLRSEKTVDFKSDQLIDLQMSAGPVVVRSVKFTSNARESIGSRFRIRSPTATETMLRAAFDAENSEKDEWNVTFVLEFLDGKGKVIDRVSRSDSWEGEAKVSNIDHPILTYAIPFIERVKISLSAKLD